MAVTSGFFNSINHDRLYDAVQMSSMFDGIINDGVLISYKDKMMVAPSAGMKVQVKSGKAWFRHTWTLNDSSITFTLEDADPLKSRYDVIYLEVNNGDRKNTINVKTGDYSTDEDTDPVKPELTSNEMMAQYPLAYIKIEPGVTEIGEDVIENMIGTESCPFANGLIEQATVTELYKQWGVQFLNWWNDLRTTMQPIAEDRTTELQNEIDNLRRWTTKQTIAAESTSYIIEDANIKEDSLIDIYYSNDTVEEASRRNPKYIQEDGKITIAFSSPLSKEVVIESIRVNTVWYPT